MASKDDVQINERVTITDAEHPWFGYSGKVITKNRSGIGVRLDNTMLPLGAPARDGQFEKEEIVRG